MSPGYGVDSDAFNLDKNIRLVPDRWSDIGWKYVNEEPAESHTFKKSLLNQDDRFRSIIYGSGTFNGSDGRNNHGFKRASNSVMRNKY